MTEVSLFCFSFFLYQATTDDEVYVYKNVSWAAERRAKHIHILLIVKLHFNRRRTTFSRFLWIMINLTSQYYGVRKQQKSGKKIGPRCQWSTLAHSICTLWQAPSIIVRKWCSRLFFFSLRIQMISSSILASFFFPLAHKFNWKSFQDEKLS